MKKIVVQIKNIQMMAGVIFISIFLITILLQIILRVVEISAMWTEDVIKNSFVWAVFMGAAVMVAEKEHFSFTTFADKFKGKKKILLEISVCSIMSVFSLAMFYYGVIVTNKFWNYQWANIPTFKMGFAWLCLPICGATMTIYLFYQILENIMKIKKGDK